MMLKKKQNTTVTCKVIIKDTKRLQSSLVVSLLLRRDGGTFKRCVQGPLSHYLSMLEDYVEL